MLIQIRGLAWYSYSDLEREFSNVPQVSFFFFPTYDRPRFREKVKLVLKATRQHAYNLSTFAIIYKSAMIVMKYLNPSGPKEGPYDTFFAGLLGGYVVFGRHPGSVSQQVHWIF